MRKRKKRLTDKAFKESKCYKCVYRKKVNESTSYCPFFSCFKDKQQKKKSENIT